MQTAVGLLNTAPKLVKRSVARRSAWSNDVAALAVRLLGLVGGWADTRDVVVKGEMVRRMEEEGIDVKVSCDLIYGTVVVKMGVILGLVLSRYR